MNLQLNADSSSSQDAAAINQFFASCMPKLQRTAARLLCNPEDCEDALQDGLLSAFRHLNAFQGRAQLSTWMHVIVVNAAKSIRRKQRSQPLVFSLDQLLPEQQDLRISDTLSDPQASLEEDYARVERTRLLAQVLCKLPRQHRAIICLCDLKGLSIKEAARRLGLTISATKSLHRRANHSLSKAIQQLPTLSGSKSKEQASISR